jgi:hypothetical protein
VKVIELILPKDERSRGLVPNLADPVKQQTLQIVSALSKMRKGAIIVKYVNDSLGSNAAEFAKQNMNHFVMEAILRVPTRDKQFELLGKLFDTSIPADIAGYVIEGLIEDTALTAEINARIKDNPIRDVRDLIADWLKTNMPDQLYRITNSKNPASPNEGLLSPLHGDDALIQRY